MLRLTFHEPRIPPNTGNAIRTAAATGSELHLIRPLGFDLSDAKLRRAGLDYHDLASVTVHDDLDAAFAAWSEGEGTPPRVFAFTASGTVLHSEVDYRDGDVLLFGTEPTGLPGPVLADPRITGLVRIPMLAGRRSLNLSNAAAIVVYEAWRQLGYPGAADTTTALPDPVEG
ncbi:tRNA (uridine(34)/cytosine(34)/5-carboxymethylaminomethyluridine(34)-2'-O)-methyltransferase TrmL [Nakamurella sp. YIM 132087]|uniref:Putative tRNA (cytidine(34)-2'-O)-methyltransferase n=1 Tax=Nakamurella alba TaxID=2665158 RepID=A0A7K1FKD4_9ACTN|nr:tRNA (cytidine(34)-2'-O)-methyltransferase [Nakamurella alba]MTD14568.1 tRNA (uridine(34)/cytosine(34)/5-carboxymethylaminomethyluridine(34)-2'-O)-methyltransferase TrmL [Nakamurella alba]